MYVPMFQELNYIILTIFFMVTSRVHLLHGVDIARGAHNVFFIISNDYFAHNRLLWCVAFVGANDEVVTKDHKTIETHGIDKKFLF